MSAVIEVDRIRLLLDEGRLEQVDEDGHVHELQATCPEDGATAPIQRVSRGGRRITEIVFRCPTCGQDFAPEPDAMRLR